MEKTRRLRTWGGFLLLLLLLLIFLIWNILAGSVRLPASEIWTILQGGGELSQRRILLQIRLPRLLAALILGGALSVSGYLLQTFFHNPIAGPFVLGISSGAKLTVSVTMVALLSRGLVSTSAVLIAAAFAGAMLSMGFVLAISRKVRRMSLLVVCGVMIGYICTALILLSSVLSACVTAFAGPISFVGIAVPHLMKSLFGTAEPLILIPASFLGGGAFCLLCDLIARTAFAPTEVSISSVTAVFGAPIVIYMMIHRKAG